MIVKTLQLRKNLKELLEMCYKEDEDLFLDYYGKMFQIVPVSKKKTKKTHAQKIVDYFKGRKRQPFADDPIFNEADPAQEKANFRNLRYGNYGQ